MGRELSLNQHANQIISSNTQANFLSHGLNSSDSRSHTNLDQRKHSQQQRQNNFFRLNRQAPSPASNQAHNNSYSQYHPTSGILQDQIQVRIRGKNNNFETKTGSVTRTLNEIQEQEQQRRDMQKTTERLKVLEKLEKYREERLRKELEQFEEQKLREMQEFQKQVEQDEKRTKYLEKQRVRLEQMRLKKLEEELQQKREQEKAKEKEKSKRKVAEHEKEAQKKRIAEYKEKKRQTEELLANANYVDFEDLNDSMDNRAAAGFNSGFSSRGPNLNASKGSTRDALEGYVEELSMLQGRKRAPPAVQ